MATECLAYLSSSPVQAGTHGPDRDAQRRGGLLVGEVGPGDEQQHVPVGGTDVRQRRREPHPLRLRVNPGIGPFRVAFIGLGHREGIQAPGLKLAWMDVLRALQSRFETRELSYGAYFFPDLSGTSEAGELAAIDAGQIQANRIQYHGTRRESRTSNSAPNRARVRAA